MKNFMFGFTLFFCSCLLGQQKLVEYSNLSPNFFNKFKKPISIAVFPFEYNNIQTEFSQKFYDELKSALGSKPEFIINFHKNIEKIITGWSFSDIDPNNKDLLKKLNSELDIKIIVYAILDDPNSNSFTLYIINTQTGVEEYSLNYLTTANSNPYSDAVKLFTDYKQALYKTIREYGTLSIKTNPEGVFQVFLNNQLVGITPYEDNNFHKGHYKLTIMDQKNIYENYIEEFDYDPNKQSTLKKNIFLTKSKTDAARNIADVVPKKPEEDIKPKTKSEDDDQSAYSSSISTIDQKRTTILLFGSFPQNDFASKEGGKAGAAETGGGFGLEFDFPISINANWVLSGTYSINEWKPGSAIDDKEKKYSIGMISTGTRIRFPISSSSDFYLLAHLGVLISKLPDLENEVFGPYLTYKEEIKSDPAIGFLYGAGTGFRFGSFDIGVRYYYSNVEYKLKYGYSQRDSQLFSNEIKIEMPYSAVLFTIGIRW